MQYKLFFLLVSYFLTPAVATCNDGGGYSPAPFYFGWFQCAPGNYYTQSDCGTKT